MVNAIIPSAKSAHVAPHTPIHQLHAALAVPPGFVGAQANFLNAQPLPVLQQLHGGYAACCQGGGSGQA